nr:immunoglobulin light chain junction region [Macaca mulatta]MOV79805.1 immunoglobulin light chain junction region [Macaca mulatta]MOV80339.1 immunoglobulin light chain junction region [Macaca mulatta]MOV80366.1 immunoglobulin light chain junction region [Macaca mulatta]MOV80860.1 immunoglobulin light chain junction region [Macaca mulatta]
CQQHDNSPRTF